jgi:hypothetical protein
MSTSAVAGGGSKTFSEKSVKGCYGFEFHGVVVHGVVAAPIAAAGKFCSDGKGSITELTRVLHIPGSVLHQEATGTYTVNSDGTGEAAFDVTMNGAPFSQEIFHSVITENKKTLQFVSGTVTGPGGTPTGSDTLISGTARKQ